MANISEYLLMNVFLTLQKPEEDRSDVEERDYVASFSRFLSEWPWVSISAASQPGPRTRAQLAAAAESSVGTIDVPSLRALSTAIDNWLASIKSLQDTTGEALAQRITSLAAGQFLVLNFAGHCAALIVEGVGQPSTAPAQSGSVLPQPRVYVVETRTTEYSSTKELTSKIPGEPSRVARGKEATDVLKAYMQLPSIAFTAKAHGFTASMCDAILELQRGESPYPPDSRDVRSPTYVMEWLVPMIHGARLADVTAVSVAVAPFEDRYQQNPEWKMEGHPWRRSVHYTALKAVLRVIAERLGPSAVVTYKHLKVYYLIWLLDEVMRQRKNAELDSGTVSDGVVMEMLQKIARKAAKLEDVSVAQLIKTRCEAVADELSRSLSQSMAKMHLPPLSPSLTAQRPQFDLGDAFTSFVSSGMDFKKLQSSDAELGAFITLQNGSYIDRGSLKALGSGLASLTSAPSERKLYLLRTAETLFLRLCWSESRGSEVTEEASLQEWWAEDTNGMLKDAEDVHKFVSSCWGLWQHVIAASPGHEQELHSRAILVTWTAALVIDAIARAIEPLVEQCVPPLDPDHLRQLLLIDKEEYSVAAAIDGHIKKLHDDAPDNAMTLFDHGHHADDTLRFAQAYVDGTYAASATIQSMWSTELSDMRRREDEYNAEVNRRRLEAERLRPLLKEAKAELSSSTRRRDEHGRQTQAWSQHQATVSSAQSRFSKLQSQLSAAERRVDPVIQPLPSDKAPALTVLFFLKMPIVLRRLSAIINRAQLLLISGPGGAIYEKLSDEVKVTWISHFNNNTKTANRADPRLGDEMELASSSKGKAYSHFLNDASLAVYYADLHREVYWNFNGNYISPFRAAPAQLMTELFTKRLPGDDVQKLQYVMQLPSPSDNDRENHVLCHQLHMPEWMDKISYLTFGRLRAFPNLQVREVLLALQHNSLPVTQPAVRVIVQQTLRQIGPAAAGRPGDRLWRSDFQSGAFAETFAQVLYERVDELALRTRDHRALLVYVDAAGWLAAFSLHADRVLRRANEVAASWCKAAGDDIAAAVANPEREDQLRSLLAQYYGYSILAIGGIPTARMTIADAGAMVLARVGMAVNTQVTGESNVEAARRLLPEVRLAMCAAAPVLQTLTSTVEGASGITAAVRIALATSVSQTEVLAWSRYALASEPASPTLCAKATSAANRVITINLLDGTVLVDGFPISRLPRKILDHPLYARVFETAAFLVAPSGDQTALVTNSHFDGCSYHFGFNAEGGLLVREVRDAILVAPVIASSSAMAVDNGRQVLYLLDPTLLSALPPHVRDAYSHWFDPARNIVLFRPIYFRGEKSSAADQSFRKRVTFVMRVAEAGLVFKLPGQCYCDTSAAAARVLANPPDASAPPLQLLLPPSDGSIAHIINVLKKFEQPEYTLPYARVVNGAAVEQSKLQRIEFHRLGLGLVLKDDGKLWSEEYMEYSLGHEQQLSNTLPGYRQYLVLESSRPLDASLPAVRVLSRDGEFHRSLLGVSAIAGRYCSWEIDRLGQLVGSTIDDQLALACAYAATSTQIADPLAGVTGLERAMQLLRRCWQNRPFEKRSLERLTNMYVMARASREQLHGAYAMQFLLRYLHRSSVSVAFLHVADGVCEPPDSNLSKWYNQMYSKSSAKGYWIRKLQHNDLCCLTAEEERVVFGKQFGQHESSADRAPTTKWNRFSSWLLGDAEAAKRSAYTQLSHTSFFERDVSCSSRLSAFSFNAAVPSTMLHHWFSLYERFRNNAAGTLEYNRAWQEAAFLALESHVPLTLSPNNKQLYEDQVPNAGGVDAVTLSSILLLVAMRPDLFPAVPWADTVQGSALSYDARRCSADRMEISSTKIADAVKSLWPIVIQTYDLGHHTYSERRRIEEQRTDAAQRERQQAIDHVWELIRRHDLDDQHRPLPAKHVHLFYDVKGTSGFGLDAQSSISASYPLLATLSADLASHFRPACRSVGLKTFLDLVFNSCTAVAGKLRTVQPLASARLPPRASATAGPLHMRMQAGREHPQLSAAAGQVTAVIPPRDIKWIQTRLDTCMATSAPVASAQPIVNPQVVRLKRDMDDITARIGQVAVSIADPSAAFEMGRLVVQLQQVQNDLNAASARAAVANANPPLASNSFDSPIGKEIAEELSASWMYHKAELAKPQPALTSWDVAFYQKLHAEVTQQMHDQMAAIQAAVATYPTSVSGLAYSAAISARVAAPPTLEQILASSLTVTGSAALNPFWDQATQTSLHQAIRCWMLLRVYADQLTRLQVLAKAVAAGEDSARWAMELELSNKRDWAAVAAENPAWLLFELEQGLAIRPVQRAVAAKMITSPGELLQLNMGEGKTKVIVPMLCCHWADGTRVVRLNVLRAQFATMSGYLVRVLSGLLGRRVYELPFNRDVSMSNENIAAIARTFKQCKAHGGVMIAAPEHRLSLRLKWLELGFKERQAAADADEKSRSHYASLRETLSDASALPILELLDESDELLRHTYQLIYTVGCQEQVNKGWERWTAAQVLLRYLDTYEDLIGILADPNNALRDQQQREPGAFHGIRVTSSESSKCMDQIKRRLVDLLVTQPPPEFPLLGQQNTSDTKLIRQFLMNEELASKEDMQHVQDRFKSDEMLYPIMLACRGLLTYGVLDHALVKRHKVEYGLNRSGKRLAVPYRAKDSPADRTEFGHPDVALILTTLNYYYDGLTRAQVKEAVESLLKKGSSERDNQYAIWLQLSSSAMSETDRGKLSTASRLDIQNELQLDILHEYFGFNRETVNFWLSNVVFPNDALQFPQKLTANAWDIAAVSLTPDAGTVAVHGFSGTNDNARTLPLSVQQSKPLPQLAGTNGKVLDYLTDPQFRNTRYASVGQEWPQVMEALLQVHAEDPDHGPVALIDAGALMVGVSNKEVVCRVMHALPDRFRGGLYFDEGGNIVVIDKHGRVSPVTSSPVRPADCFVYLDDEHTRGTDLKLRPTAHAIVTIGKGMNKDKLVQAAMRMRQLGKGQTVSFFGSTEVTMKIVATCGVAAAAITSVDVMRWVTRNTVDAQEKGILEWARQGSAFGAKNTASARLEDASPAAASVLMGLCIEDELLAIEAFYAGVLGKRKSADVIMAHSNAVQQHIARMLSTAGDAELEHGIEAEIKEKLRLLCRKLEDTGHKYVGDLMVACSALDEEYERELEMQVEEEIQRQLPGAEDPAPFAQWDVAQLLQPQTMAAPTVTAQLLPASSVLSTTRRLSTAVKRGTFTVSDRLLVTQNFVRVLKARSAPADDYLRAIDVVLFICDAQPAAASSSGLPSPGTTGTYILLAGREADALLPLLWTRCSASAVVPVSSATGAGPGTEIGKRSHAAAFEDSDADVDMDTSAGGGASGSSSSSNSTRPDVVLMHYPLTTTSLSLCLKHHAPTPRHLAAAPRGMHSVRLQLRVLMGECAFPVDLRRMLRQFLGIVGRDDLRALLPASSGAASAAVLGQWLREKGIVSTNGGVVLKHGPTLLDMLQSGVVLPSIDEDGTELILTDSETAALRSVIDTAANSRRITANPAALVKTLVELRGHTNDFEKSDLSSVLEGT